MKPGQIVQMANGNVYCEVNVLAVDNAIFSPAQAREPVPLESVRTNESHDIVVQILKESRYDLENPVTVTEFSRTSTPHGIQTLIRRPTHTSRDLQALIMKQQRVIKTAVLVRSMRTLRKCSKACQ